MTRIVNIDLKQSSSDRLSREELKVLMDHARPHLWPFPIIVALGVISSFAETFGISLVILYFYSAMGRSADAASSGGLLGGMFTKVSHYFPNSGSLALLVLSMILLKALVACSYTMLAGRMQHHLGHSVRSGLHRQFVEVEYDYIRRFEQSEMMNVLATQSWAVSNGYAAVSRILVNGVTLLVMISSLFVISWPLTTLALMGAAILVATTQILARPARQVGRRSSETAAAMANKMLHTLQGMRAIRAFGQEQIHQNGFEAASAAARRVAVHTEILRAALMPVSEVGYVVLLAAMVGLAHWLNIPFPVTLAAVAILYRLQTPMRELQSSLLNLSELQSPLKAVARVLVRADKRYPPQGAHPFIGLDSAITFKNVSFGYNGQARDKALRGVNLTIPAGKTTAIVGASGAGKTTLINLLLRLDEPTGGEILVDGVVLSSIDRKAWLSRVALAGQDVELMESDIRSNINVSRPEASDDEIMAVAEMAGIADVIRGQEFGLDHWIGSQGANLSGGQRQRLGLARALLRDPEVLILDEATSALDPDLEAVVRDNLAKQFAGRTLIIITHRLNTVTDADHVIFVEGGQVVRQGPQRQMLKKNSQAALSLSDLR